MEKSKSCSLTGLGNGSAIIPPRNFDGKVETLPVTQDTMVTLHQNRKGCYFSRAQVAIFAVAFILSLVLVVLLLTFVRKEQIIHVPAGQDTLCNCRESVNVTSEKNLHEFVETKVKGSRPKDDSDSGVLLVENLTRREEKRSDFSESTIKTDGSKEENSDDDVSKAKNLTRLQKSKYAGKLDNPPRYRGQVSDSNKGAITAENSTQVENTLEKSPSAAQNETRALNTSDENNITNQNFPWMNIRLPRDILPQHYEIYLRIDLENQTFTGAVNISVNVSSSKRYVYFHINFLWILKDTVTMWSRYENKYYPIKNQFVILDGQFYVLEMEASIPVGQYVIGIGRYFGRILRDLKGLYLSSYETEDKSIRYLAATQLQATDARKVFPCFDEPDMKASYQITIDHKEGYQALNNMPVETKQVLMSSPGWIRVKFRETPIMSTYLLAIVVSDFQYTETTIFDDYKLRVWAQPQKVNQTYYALKYGTIIHKYFTEYFGIPDVVPKADHVAVPDFSGGAMENWGLVIYRETALLFDPDVSSSENQLMVTLIIAHEIAHTWFGNMVTMRWWDDLWLNEGFASLLMYFAMDHAFPEWNVFTLHVVVQEVFTVMIKDALTTSHPVSTPILTPDDIVQTFDTIAYNKGMAVLRMLLSFVGWEDFKLGLRLYVNRYKFNNAEMDELWATFSEAVNNRIDIKSIMDTWTRQMGYPVVTITHIEGYYQLEQEWFLLDGNSSMGMASEYNYRWNIPFTYITDQLPNVSNPTLVWMDMDKTTTLISRSPKDKWLLGNVDYVGYYRVNYELSMWESLAKQLNEDHEVFPEANRAGLIGDSLNLARARLLDYEVALSMTTYLKKEEKYAPWKAMLESIRFLKGMLSEQGAYVLLRQYLHDLVAPVFDKVGTSPDGSLPEKYLREVILTTACDVGVDNAVSYATEMFRKWKEEGLRLPSHFALTIYSVGVREGSVEEWDYVWNRSLATNVAAEREMLMDALAQSQKPWLLWRYANWIFDDSKIKRQDVRLVVSYFTKNPLGRMIALHLLQNQWEKLVEQFGEDGFLLRETIAEVTQFVNTEFELTQLDRLFLEKKAKIAFRETQNALELIRANIKWMGNNYDTISAWLRRHVVGML